MTNQLQHARQFCVSSDTIAPIYMDYHASTPLDPRVFEAMRPYFLHEYGNPHSTDHAFGWRADAAIAEARTRIGELIGADPDEIIFTSGATEANNLAIIGAARQAPPQRRRVIVSAIEHKCVIASAQALTAEGFEVVMVPPMADGIIDPDLVAAEVDERTAVVSVMTINNEIGTIQPISEIASTCRAKGAIFHTDAAQALAVLHN
jgi:cysteine desulfurase